MMLKRLDGKSQIYVLLLLLPRLLMMMALLDEVFGNHPTFDLEFDNDVLSQCRYAQIVVVPLFCSYFKFFFFLFFIPLLYSVTPWVLVILWEKC